MEKSPRIYFFEVEQEDRELVLQKYPEARIFEEAFSKKIISQCQDAELVCGMVHSEFSAENLSQLAQLKMVALRTAGYNNVDLAWCAAHRIPVCNVPDYGSHVIAEHVFALLLASVRRVLEGEERTSRDNFSCTGMRGIALKGKTLGVIGVGKIGAHVCRIASKGFLMNVIAYDKFQNPELAQEYGFQYVGLEELLAKSDIISLHVPLFPETQHMINKDTIAKMKDGVCLVNTARGGIINTPDLIAAIKAGKFSHVALDVIEHEENIKEDAEILHLPGVIITPHVAFCADDSVHNMYTEAFKSIEAFINEQELKYQVHGH